MSAQPPVILVVDDELRIVELLRLNFELEGYHVIEASNGRQALRLVQAQPPDLILLDLVMPLMSGFETLEQIRALSNVPVIMLSADNDETLLAHGRALGMTDWMRKPFSLRQLLSRVKALLESA